MKKAPRRVFCALLALCTVFALWGCGAKTADDVPTDATAADTTAETTTAKRNAYTPRETTTREPDSRFDVDLTSMNSTMVYAAVSDMVAHPEKYTGQSVKIQGVFRVFPGDGRDYYACLISDALACCQQGVEFILKDGVYPDDDPPVDSTVVVGGTFDAYEENGYTYCQLLDASVY